MIHILLVLGKIEKHYGYGVIQILVEDYDQHRRTGTGNDYNVHSSSNQNILWSSQLDKYT